MNVFELFGTIAVNNKGANKGIDETSTKAQKLANTFGRVGQEAMKIGKTVAKGLAVVGAAGTAAVGLLLKNSIGNYAEYEQLVGGIETLFKDSQGRVMEYAENAYKTAGLSANEYMATATSFAASLLQGLGGDTEAAATMTDMAIQDMADNANKMGTDISMIQNAYQGFAKQNYTMLDNLKLGYGGTATEMARLINDSGVMGDTFVATAKNLNEVSFAKMIEAIHVIQTEMGITGTTAEEAEKTITGSFNAWKSAGSNLLTAIASGDSASIQEATAAFTAQTKVLLENLGPVVTNVLNSIGTLMTDLLPGIGQQALDFGSDIIAKIINGITGSSITSEDVKTAINNILDIGSTALDNTLSFIKDALQWISDNKEFVVGAIAAIGAAFLAFKLATNPVGAILDIIAAGLVLLVTNWNDIKAAIEGAIQSLREFLGLSPTVSKAQEDYVQQALANQEPTAYGKYAGRYAYLPEAQRDAAWNYAAVMASGKDATAELQEMYDVGLGEEAIHNIQADVSEAVASGEYNADNIWAMFEPAAEANLQNQLDSMSLTADVSPSVSGADENADGSHASGLNFVPWDNYRANLHMGEMVLPRNEAEAYRNGHGGIMNTSKLENLMQQVLGIMQQVAANTAGGQTVVLDSGVLVGQLAPRMDAQLGTLTARKERRG
jgi:hypothetical protein